MHPSKGLRISNKWDLIIDPPPKDFTVSKALAWDYVLEPSILRKKSKLFEHGLNQSYCLDEKLGHYQLVLKDDCMKEKQKENKGRERQKRERRRKMRIDVERDKRKKGDRRRYNQKE